LRCLGRRKRWRLPSRTSRGDWSKLREWLNPVCRWLIATIYSNYAFGCLIQKCVSAGFSIP
jgi:hypothetical protein